MSNIEELRASIVSYDNDVRKKFHEKFVGNGRLKKFCETAGIDYKVMRQYTSGQQKMTDKIRKIMETAVNK
jgi:hypothetical protein